MIKEFKAFFTLFQKGKELANSTIWKNRQIVGNTLVSLLSAAVIIAGGFGYNIEIDDETLRQVGMGIGAIYAAVNAVITCITSARVGI